MRSILKDGFSNRVSECSELESSGRFVNKFSTRIATLSPCAYRSSVIASPNRKDA
jgi:hypothetical protein